MKMAGIEFLRSGTARAQSLPACPRPRDNGESLVRIDGLDARIRYAASYRAAGIACAPQLLGTGGGRAAAAGAWPSAGGL